MENCIFCKIASGAIPTKFIYEDDEVIVFPDIHPAAKVHLLVVPKKHVSEFVALEDENLRSHLFKIVHKLIKDQGIHDKRYRITINGGGAQDIDHLHIHVMSPV